MSAQDLQALRAWATECAADRSNPAGERRLSRQVASEVRAYERVPATTPGGVPLCSICREPGGHHRSLATGRFVADHDASEGLLW